MNIVAGADYRAKFATTMSPATTCRTSCTSSSATRVAPNLPGFFKAKCADLTPYLAGDAAKDYPNLAAIPTPAWKNSISAIDGALYLIPIHRQMTSIPPYGGNFFKNVDMWDTEIGQDYVPKNADDFKKALDAVDPPAGEPLGHRQLRHQRHAVRASARSPQMFGAPNNWKLDAVGKLIKDRETEEYKAAVGFMRDLFAAGVYSAGLRFSRPTSRADFVGKKFAVSPEGQGNSWVDFWQRGLQQNAADALRHDQAVRGSGRPEADPLPGHRASSR